MKRKYYPYWEWEDFINGMYEVEHDNEEKKKLAIELLTNQELFFDVATTMIEAWPKSAEQNLFGAGNKLAWIGQASCCYQYSVCELITKQAWVDLTDKQKNEANLTALKVLKLYEEKYRKIHKGMENEGLFV